MICVVGCVRTCLPGVADGVFTCLIQLAGFRVGQAVNGASQFLCVVRVDLDRVRACNLRCSALVTDENRCAAGHGFEHGHSEPFVERGKQKRLGAGVERGQVRSGNIACKNDPFRQAHLLDLVDQAPRFVVDGAGDYQSCRLTCEASRVGIDQSVDVLAGDRRADVQEVPFGKSIVSGDPGSLIPG